MVDTVDTAVAYPAVKRAEGKLPARYDITVRIPCIRIDLRPSAEKKRAGYAATKSQWPICVLKIIYNRF